MTPFQETCWAGMDSMIPLHFILTGLLTCRLEAVHVWEQLDVLLGMVLVGAKEQIKQMNVLKKWIPQTSPASLISLKNHGVFYLRTAHEHYTRNTVQTTELLQYEIKELKTHYA